MQSTKFRVNWSLGSGEEEQNRFDFQDCCHGRHLGLPIGTILTFYDLQVTPMLPTKFRVNWPFASGEEPKIDFQHGSHLGFPNETI